MKQVKRPGRGYLGGAHNDMATEKQINYILSLADRRGILGGTCKHVSGIINRDVTRLMDLKRGEAGRIIAALR